MIEALQALPASTRDATAVIGCVDYDDEPKTVAIASVTYEYGEVVLANDDYDDYYGPD